MERPKIIRDASTAQQSSKKVMDGIINSGMLTEFQRNAIDGVIRSGLPEQRRKKENKPMLQSVRPDATKSQIGYVGFQGRSF